MTRSSDRPDDTDPGPAPDPNAQAADADAVVTRQSLGAAPIDRGDQAPDQGEQVTLTGPKGTTVRTSGPNAERLRRRGYS